ncbi:hypothetical protein [Spirillospora sp. NPDC047279]|uniref:hypothetical protein n=1 Tax=Spirillospora sp. NPDC047279 TaxID=3155478 RepID=UPI0033D655E7
MPRKPGSTLAASAVTAAVLLTTLVATATPASASSVSCNIPRYAGSYYCATGVLGTTNLHQITVTARYGYYPADIPPSGAVTCRVYDVDTWVNVGVVSATRLFPTQRATIPGLYNRYFAQCVRTTATGGADYRGGGGGELWND